MDNREFVAYVNTESVNFCNRENKLLYGLTNKHPEFQQAHDSVVKGSDWLRIAINTRYVGDAMFDCYMNLAADDNL